MIDHDDVQLSDRAERYWAPWALIALAALILALAVVGCGATETREHIQAADAALVEAREIDDVERERQARTLAWLQTELTELRAELVAIRDSLLAWLDAMRQRERGEQ